MKVSGAMAMADNLEAFGMKEPQVRSESMVDRVAEAIHDAANNAAYDDGWHCSLGMARDAALAAIEAMRVPTREMISASFKCNVDPEAMLHTQRWKAMIDAALKETK